MTKHDTGRPEEGKLYQDPIYGAKVLSPLAVAIMDTAEFQRLNDLRQLGFADLVYRGAKHTRFSHSVGTYFISRTICRRILQNHERLGLQHPGASISERFRLVPSNADLPTEVVTHQSRWRGLTEVVSAAALLHDIGHVPFGHTLEDEYTGFFERHDSLGGVRLHAMMFDTRSQLQQVFSDALEPWIPKLTNGQLAQLIYVILSWKEDLVNRLDFPSLLEKKFSQRLPATAEQRVRDLKQWHGCFSRERLFSPFMSDIIGNTICADLLDYLPRDRLHLGMEPRRHSRLHRAFVIRPGTYYGNDDREEGRRLTIMVERRGHGGQRVDVATAVLSIMRERYEMAERVFYHHKKAAASAMLAHLFELAKEDHRPRDDDEIYPAPWDTTKDVNEPPHMVHLSDTGLIEYLGHAPVSSEEALDLQRRLYSALRAKRSDMYRTLLVIDVDLANSGSWDVGRIALDLRSKDGRPSANGRHALETRLVAAANTVSPTRVGEVLVYCPSPSMQSKEVDARLELKPDDVKPLSQQVGEFKYSRDVAILQDYYKALWRAYVFVSPEVFTDPGRCLAIVNEVSNKYTFPKSDAYRKVRGHRFTSDTVYLKSVTTRVQGFLKEVPFATELTNAHALLEMVNSTGAELTSADGGACDNAVRRRLGALLELLELRRLNTEAKTEEHKKLVTARMEMVRDNDEEAILNRRGTLLAKGMTADEYRAEVQRMCADEPATASAEKKRTAKADMGRRARQRQRATRETG